MDQDDRFLFPMISSIVIDISLISLKRLSRLHERRIPFLRAGALKSLPHMGGARQMAKRRGDF